MEKEESKTEPKVPLISDQWLRKWTEPENIEVETPKVEVKNYMTDEEESEGEIN